ncbi:MAG TPA: type II toxin-antitoxin system RelE/ParE family toxin [Pirellulales bacterium]|nr:type II toxin-antitoxin system RelE/ParE family toxin [Pirellulales bacterium]
MAKLVWSPRALQDLDGICRYIEQDSADYARLFGERLIAMIESIPQHPYWGSVVPEYGREDLRERRFQSYRVVYRVATGRIDVISITHGARLLPPASD